MPPGCSLAGQLIPFWVAILHWEECEHPLKVIRGGERNTAGPALPSPLCPSLSLCSPTEAAQPMTVF